jgi:phthiocerol/phenolphthiocerol synthesis type-I polyketide synthase E
MNRTDPRRMLKEALLELQDLRRQLEAREEPEPERVAIIGTAARGGDKPARGRDSEFLLLETAWQALENAGRPPSALPRSRTAVFLGIADDQASSSARSTAQKVTAAFGFGGPVLTIAAGHTSALTAVHLACCSLVAGECDVALAGGIAPGAADCHLVVLKRLSQARQERDFIWAQVRGSHHGAGPELTALPELLSGAGLTAVDAAYVSRSENYHVPEAQQLWQSAHPAAGEYGDRALASVVRWVEGEPGQATGMAGLAAALAALHTGSGEAGSGPDAPAYELKVVLAGAFSTQEQLYVLLERAVLPPPAAAQPPYLTLLAAESQEALPARARDLAAYLEIRPDINLADAAYTTRAGRHHFGYRRAVLATERNQLLRELRSQSESDIPAELRLQPETKREVAFLFPGLGNHYLNMGRELLEREGVFRVAMERCALILRSYLGVDLRDLLYVEGGTPQNDNAAGAGLDLRLMLGRSGFAAGDGEAGERLPARLQQTAVAQPLLFTIEYALSQLLQYWGIRPAAMLGYSIGEYVAAHLAGVFTLEEALFLVATRARLIQELPPGKMLAVPLSETDIRARTGGRLTASAINGPDLCVVAGEPAAVDALAAELAAEAIATREVPATHAFHTDLMRPIGPAFLEALRQVRLRAPDVPYVSNVSGDWITAADAASPGYWLEHACRPVRFGEGVHTLATAGHDLLLEVGPGQALSSLVTGLSRDERGPAIQALPTMRYEYDRQSDTAVLYQAVAGLWQAGMAVDWERFDVAPGTRRVPLPAYPQPPVPPQASTGRQAIPDAGRPERPPAATSNGDLAAQNGTARANGYRAPADGVEQTLVGIWRRVLKIGDFDARRTFFELGGNSLLATQLIFQLRKAFQVDVSLRAVFEAPTIAGLVGVVRQQQGARQPLPPGGSERPDREAQVTTSSAFVQQECELPNGLVVACQSPAETAHFYEDIFQHRSYLRHGIALPEGATVFDVGANIGLFTLFVHLNCPGARIYTFEPAPPLFQLLQANVSRHGVNARLYPCALSRQAGTAALTFYPHSSGMSSLYPDLAEEKEALTAVLQNQVRRGQAEVAALLAHADDYLAERFRHETFTCPVRTLSEIVDETAVDRLHLLKIDVQKSELDVLLGIRDEHWPLIDQIVLEVHDAGGRLDTISRLLRQKAYQVTAEQDELYAGSPIYNVYARRVEG